MVLKHVDIPESPGGMIYAQFSARIAKLGEMKSGPVLIPSALQPAF